MRPTPDLLRGSKHDADGVKVGNGAGELEWIRTEQGVPPWQAFLALPRLFPGFLEDPSFPGGGVYRFQRRILKNFGAVSHQLSAFSFCRAAAKLAGCTLGLKADS
jgi:hypothetical protein